MSKKEDDERLWNLVVFNCYATDKEMEGVFPIVAIVVGLLGLIYFVSWMVGGSK